LERYCRGFFTSEALEDELSSLCLYKTKKNMSLREITIDEELMEKLANVQDI